MIERSNHNEVIFVCDGCADEEQTGTTSIKHAWEEIKEIGWRREKDGFNWEHFCKDCS
jgi:hypothetical protein